MKKYIGLLLAVAVAVAARIGYAANSTTNEPAATDGNFGMSETAVTYTSTGTTVGAGAERTFVIRRVRVENDGTQSTIWGVHRTSMSAVLSSSHTHPMDVMIPGATIYVNGSVTLSSGILINPNVLAVASPARPVLLKRVRAGNQVGTANAGALVRIWDTRGSTTNAPGVQPLFEETLTTGAVRDLDIWISSGIVVKTGVANAIISVDFDEFNTNNQDPR